MVACFVVACVIVAWVMVQISSLILFHQWNDIYNDASKCFGSWWLYQKKWQLEWQTCKAFMYIKPDWLLHSWLHNLLYVKTWFTPPGLRCFEHIQEVAIDVKPFMIVLGVILPRNHGVLTSLQGWLVMVQAHFRIRHACDSSQKGFHIFTWNTWVTSWLKKLCGSTPPCSPAVWATTTFCDVTGFESI